MGIHDNQLEAVLSGHVGHNAVVACYGSRDDPVDICLECEDCWEVLLDAELYTLEKKDGNPNKEGKSFLWDMLGQHIGHHIVAGRGNDSIFVKCKDCGGILFDTSSHMLAARD